MTEIPSSVAQVQERFRSLNLHDALLLGIIIQGAGADDDEEIRLSIEMVVGRNADQWKPAELRLVGCVQTSISLDLWAKRQCSHMIGDGHCTYDREWVRQRQIEEPIRQRAQRLENILKFTIDMCPPGGTLDIFARDFQLNWLDASRE